MRLTLGPSDQWLKTLSVKLLEQRIAHSELSNVALITYKKYNNRKTTGFPVFRQTSLLIGIQTQILGS